MSSFAYNFMDILLQNLPSGLLLILSGLIGVIIGSFLNVFLYRFHTGRNLGGTSHCLSCGSKLSPLELIPLLSYVFLRGRCQNCSSYIPSRYFIVEAMTAILFAAVFSVSSGVADLLFGWMVVILFVCIAVYDWYHMVIPDEFTFALTVVMFFGWIYKMAELNLPVDYFVYSVGAAFLTSVFLFLLWKVSRGAWIGFGDVKLVFPLALGLGYTSAFSLVVLSFWIGACLGLALLLAQKMYRRGQPHLRLLDKELTIKSAVPFAPFLILAYLTIYLWHIDVVALLSYA